MRSITNKSNNVNSSCEQCGGQMKITTTDRHNKIMECLYCGHVIDIPDNSNNLINLGSHEIFKNDIFDGAFSNLNHQSFLMDSNFGETLIKQIESSEHSSLFLSQGDIPADVQSAFHELLSDKSFDELGGVSRTYTRGNSSFIISTEGVSNKSISASFSSNTNIHSVVSTKTAPNSSSGNSNTGVWLFTAALLILIFIGILFG